MLELQNILIQYRDRKVLDGVSWQIGEGDHCGLVGVNGSGKSTILKILMGITAAHNGNIVKSKHCNIGYLPQDIEPIRGMNLRMAAESAFITHKELELNLANADEDLLKLDHKCQEYSRLLNRIAEWEDQLSHQDHIPAKVERVLLGLGFKREQFELDVSCFSGGWQTRILMARLLLQNPSLLLLDEPTNHLDLAALCWFENFLKKYTGAFIIVSHDRRFLNNLCDKIVHLDHGNLTVYPGNYDNFEVSLAEKLEQEESAYESQQKEIHRVQAFIDRFRYKATKAAQVQSRIKMLDKVERLSISESAKHIAFGFPPALESGAWMIHLDKVSHSYGPKQIFSNLTARVERQDRIAIVGNNGEGKSTLLRLLAQVEQLQQGIHNLGHKVVLSYFSQQQADYWQEEQTVLEGLTNVAPPSMGEGKLRSILGSFLFTKDDVFKKIVSLSGGEKARLKLAGMLIKASNCLLLDEPTNHLDMIAKDRLQQALMEYEGALVIVSHDRDFLEPIVNKVWEVKDKKINIYHGSISYYLEKTESEREEAISTIQKKNKSEKKHLPPPIKKINIAKVEEKITTLESEIKQIHEEMQSPDFFSDNKKSEKILIHLKECESALDEQYKLWDSLT